MGRWIQLGHVARREFLKRDALGQFGIRLVNRRTLAGNRRHRRAPHTEREKWFAGYPIQQEHVADFRNLRDGINFSTVMRNSDEIGRRRHVEIPNVVPNFLKMP